MHQVQHNQPGTSYQPGYSDNYTGWVEPLPPTIEKKAQEQKKTAESEKAKKAWELSDERENQFRESKDYLMSLMYDLTVPTLEAAQLYMYEWPDIEAEPLRNSPQDERQTAWKKFNRKTRPAQRLFGSLDVASLYTLHAEHLGLPAHYGHAENFPLGSYDPELRAAWLKAIRKQFKGQTYFYKFENATRFHVHLIASHDAGLLHLRRDGEVIKAIKPGEEEKVLTYLYKPHATYTEANLEMWIRARREAAYYTESTAHTKNLPKACNYVGLISASKWNA